jgi:hypothetical protein
MACTDAMKKRTYPILISGLWLISAIPVTAQAVAETAIAAPTTDEETDARKMEKDLQQLPWKRFRSVVEAVPKMKASIEAFGPIGWQFVQTNYTTYGWKRNIDKLDDAQKKRLAELIQTAKDAR